ncbi:MAG: hypothetical protein ACJA1C_002426 [Crocinitomicaceae bacterium]|jgi:hypothetical protein
MDLIEGLERRLKSCKRESVKIISYWYDKFHTVILIFTLNIPNREQRN